MLGVGYTTVLFILVQPRVSSRVRYRVRVRVFRTFRVRVRVRLVIG